MKEKKKTLDINKRRNNWRSIEKETMKKCIRKVRNKNRQWNGWINKGKKEVRKEKVEMFEINKKKNRRKARNK